MTRFVLTAACLAAMATARTSLASGQNGRIAMVSRLPITIETFWIAADGAVNDSFEYYGGSWATYPLAPPGSASTSSRITAVSRASNTMELWYVGQDGSVQDKYWIDGIGWQGLALAPPGSASLNGGITAASRAPNTMEVWYVAPDGSVRGWDFYDNVGWQPYQLAPAGSASTSSAIAAVSRTSTALEVWYEGPDGSVEGHYNNFDGFNWQSYQLAPPGSTTLTPGPNSAPAPPGAGAGLAVVSRAPNTMELWYVGADRSVQDWFWYEGNQWQNYPLAPAGSASANSSIAAVSRASNTMELWFQGADGSVQDAFWYDGGGPWGRFPLEGPGMVTDGWISAVSPDSNTMEVFYIGAGGANGSVQAELFSNGWSPTPTVLPQGGTGAATPDLMEELAFNINAQDACGDTATGTVYNLDNGDWSIANGMVTLNGDVLGSINYTLTCSAGPLTYTAGPGSFGGNELQNAHGYWSGSGNYLPLATNWAAVVKAWQQNGGSFANCTLSVDACKLVGGNNTWPVPPTGCPGVGPCMNCAGYC
jgi:hypothetical protein